MSLLATFVHVSDLHFGVPDPQTGNGNTTADLRTLASTYHFFHGSLGHQARSLRYLESYINGLRTAGEQFELLVTGDFTRCGHLDEFDLAHDYLTSAVRLRPGRVRPTGLRLGALPEYVPGNHDHWGGYNLPFSTTPTLFPHSRLQRPGGFPYIASKQCLLGRQLVFYGIDSDADVPPGSLRRAFAHGHFVSQLDTLYKQLTPNRQNELRVLVIHHARHSSGHRLRMSNASKSKLDLLCQAKGIQIVLSGHTHKAHTAPISKVLEFCSPSTTQIDEAPAGWVNWRGARPTVKFLRNGFLVHRLHNDAGAIRWDVHVMVRDPQGQGFIEASVQRFSV